MPVLFPSIGQYVWDSRGFLPVCGWVIAVLSHIRDATNGRRISKASYSVETDMGRDQH